MITYINKDNAKAYQDLFAEATKLLKNQNPHPNIGIREDDWDTFSIGTLNQYFAYLETIVNLSSQDERKLSMFLRLPLDEEAFDINADTRTITVPTSFSRYGVGVCGDEAAEIIYFTIDRFFDHQDLFNLDIAVQWESKNPDYPVGFTPNFGKEVINVQDPKTGEWKSKIIFGWPISGELTKVNGVIKFAVRFYKLDTNNDFVYSFATLPAEVAINNTLNYSMVADGTTLHEVNHGAELINRIKSAGIYDYNAEMPENPTINVQLYALNSVGRVIDLPAGDQGVDLAISAQPTTSGVIGYIWHKYSYVDGEYSHNYGDLTDSEDPAVERFIPVTTNIATTDSSYFYDANNNLIENLAVLLKETNGYYVYDEEEGGFERLDSDPADYVIIKRKFSSATVHSVGKYFVTVSARAGVNERSIDSEIITIPGPEKPIISYENGANITNDDETVHVIVDQNGTAILKVNAQTGESDPSKTAEEVGSNPVVGLSYEWFNATTNEAVDTESSTQVDSELVDSTSSSTLTIDDLSTTNLDVSYYATVTASRNREITSGRSYTYRITTAPQKPVLKYRKIVDGNYVYVPADYNTEDAPIPIQLKDRFNNYNKISFAADPPAQCDKLSYIWMKATIDPTNDADYYPGTNNPIWRVDIDNALPDLFVDAVGDPDQPANGIFNLEVINSLGEIIDSSEEGNMPSLDLEHLPYDDANKAGYYYCIVVNELNNHRVANVTPFFSVS